MADAPTKPDGAAVAVGDGAFGDQLVAQRDAPVGGQAVLEGVMMRGISTWAGPAPKPLPPRSRAGGFAAGEDPPGDIEITTEPLTSVLKKHRVLRLPLIRGVAALGESLAIGFKALG